MTQWFGQNDKFEWLNDLSMLLNPGQPLYLLVYAVAIIFFSFFYTAMQYNPRDTADNLKNLVHLSQELDQVNKHLVTLIK